MELIVRFINQFLTVVVLALVRGPPLLISKLISTGTSLVSFVALSTVDLVCFILNLLLPQKPKGSVVAKGDQGYRGLWPEWQPPVQGADSRSPCPYLSALLCFPLSFAFTLNDLTFPYLVLEFSTNRRFHNAPVYHSQMH